MNRRIESPPDITRADADIAVITIRHTGGAARQKEIAEAAGSSRGHEAWPGGLLSWSLFASTDGQALMAYEQWGGEQALDRALAMPTPYVPGIPGTEPSPPVRYRLYRSHVIDAGQGAVGCIVTPVFDTDGPERQRHFVNDVFTITKDVTPMPGSIAAHFHTSTDGTRVFNYAEWSDEQAHIDALTADDPKQVRRRVSREIPGVRPCGYHRWSLSTALVASDQADVR